MMPAAPTTHLARVFEADGGVSTWCGPVLARQVVATRISLVDCAACRTAFAASLRALPDVTRASTYRAPRSVWEESD